jgi:hypothetical protein
MEKTIIRKRFKKWLAAAALVLVLLPAWLAAAELQAIKLNPPSLKRGLPFMETLSVRASAREYSPTASTARPKTRARLLRQ